MDNQSEEYMRVTDFLNIVSFYKPLCEKCEKEIDRNSNRQKMCQECWNEKHRENSRKTMKKIRNNNVVG